MAQESFVDAGHAPCVIEPVPKHRCRQALLAAGTFAGLAAGCAVATDYESTPPDANATTDRIARNAVVNKGQVASPLGNYVFVRRGAVGCAVRFMNPRRAQDEQTPSRYTSGEPTQYVEYEALYQGDGSFDFSKSNVDVQQGYLSNRASVGLGHVISVKPGAKLGVQCGQMLILWLYPHALTETVHNGSGFHYDQSLELAPTAINQRTRINFSHPLLVWYKVDSIKVNEIVVPWDVLPK